MKNKKVKTFNEFHGAVYDFRDLKKMKVDHIAEDEDLIPVSMKSMNITDDETYLMLFGYNPIFTEMRIKVIDKFTKNCFVILFEKSFNIIGDFDKNILSNEVVSNIERWINMNKNIIINFSKEEYAYCPFEFSEKLIKL